MTYFIINLPNSVIPILLCPSHQMVSSYLTNTAPTLKKLCCRSRQPPHTDCIWVPPWRVQLYLDLSMGGQPILSLPNRKRHWALGVASTALNFLLFGHRLVASFAIAKLIPRGGSGPLRDYIAPLPTYSIGIFQYLGYQRSSQYHNFYQCERVVRESRFC